VISNPISGTAVAAAGTASTTVGKSQYTI